MNNENKIAQSAQLISKHFGISQNEFEIEGQEFINYDEILAILTRIVKYLLDKDFEKLMNGLYRIDVSEKKVSEILNVSSPDKMADEIAVLILERELQKVESRLKYKVS